MAGRHWSSPGWPNYSFGTFGGVVAVIDNFDTQESTASLLFRILMTRPGGTDTVGSGTFGWIMLKDVPIWYELWRQFNGFPPDYLGTVKVSTNPDVKSAGEKKPGKSEERIMKRSTLLVL